MKIFLLTIISIGFMPTHIQGNEPAEKVFYYGYGINLLQEQVIKLFPSACLKAVAQLKNYRLDFGRYSVRWNGAVATVIPDDDESVWGAVWEINQQEMIERKAKQQRISNRAYETLEVEVEATDGEKYKCETSVISEETTKLVEGQPIPYARKPSFAYLDKLIRGAIESGLPQEYIAKLHKVQHNGWVEPSYDPDETFLYFAYGSNLSEERIHKNNPSAVRKSAAKLEDYRLDFGRYSGRWNGAVATIIPDEGELVWGVIWEINMADMANLDRQEGVAARAYEILEVDVETIEGKIVTCRTYAIVEQPPKIEVGEIIPEERKPSLAYVKTIIRGAIESKLPPEYIRKLEDIQHNNWDELE